MTYMLDESGIEGLVTGEGQLDPNLLNAESVGKFLTPALKRVRLEHSSQLQRLREIGREDGQYGADRRIARSIIEKGEFIRLNPQVQMQAHRALFVHLAYMQAPPQPFPARHDNFDAKFPDDVPEVVTSRAIVLEQSGMLFVWKVEWKSEVFGDEGYNSHSKLRYIGVKSKLRQVTVESLLP